jgi:hypothetical protein
LLLLSYIHTSALLWWLFFITGPSKVDLDKQRSLKSGRKRSGVYVKSVYSADQAASYLVWAILRKKNIT